MIVDLIIDGNYILSKNVFALHKNNLLFGALYKSLEISITNYKKWYPFANVYLVSDSKEKSWRKKVNSEYKAQRKKNADIDWAFVMETYADFKSEISNKGVKVMEAPHIEGDDWISYIREKSNQAGRSTIIVSNDYDIKQLITYNVNPLYINIMSNEMHNKQKLFLPKNYQIFLGEVNKLNNDDIFTLNDNTDFLNLMRTFMEQYEIIEINTIECLMIKVISGDTSDNITSVWSVIKEGRKRGIGEAGAKSILEMYITEFGEPHIGDPDLYENIADIVCEKKKLSKTTITSIKENIEQNMKLIYLDMSSIPTPVKNKMENEYARLQ